MFGWLFLERRAEISARLLRECPLGAEATGTPRGERRGNQIAHECVAFADLAIAWQVGLEAQIELIETAQMCEDTAQKEQF